MKNLEFLNLSKKRFLIELLIIFILGSFTSLSLPPINFFYINFFTFSFFFIFLFRSLNQKKAKKNFFLYGWFFGFGYFLTNLYWITISLSFDKNFTYLIPIALLLIPAFLALFYSFFTFLFYLYNPKNILSAFFLFSLLFGITEFLRATILTGFPWNLIVYSFSEKLNFISIISVIGTYSLNLISISLFAAPALYICRKSKGEIVTCILLLLLPILFYINGTTQKKIFFNSASKDNPFKIRIISSNISLDRFYQNIDTEIVIQELISISSPEQNKKTLFIWPEGIIPNTYQDELYLYDYIIKKNFDKNHIIGLGITSRDFKAGKYKYYNSFSIFDNNLNLIENYNKIKLVPFGEFLPFENVLSRIGFKVITNNFESYTKGENSKIITIKNSFGEMKFLPLICYEIIYSGNLSKNYDYDFIFNISEDGWFGKSIGPKQHFVHSVFRAIENGKYVIRSSNNGISAIINPLGQIEKKIDYSLSGFIDFENRKKVKKTIFSTYGNKIFIIFILLYIFLIFSFNRVRNE